MPIESSAAIEPLQLITDCKTSTSPICISSIYITDTKGFRVKGELTGRTLDWNQSYSEQSVLKGKVEEYAFNGFTFGGQAKNLMTPLITYFPIGNSDCFYTPCVDGKEYIQVNSFPSLLTPQSDSTIQYADGKSDLRCGSKETPSLCKVPALFGQNYTFEYTLRLPSNFTYTAMTGRGIDKFKFAKGNLVQELRGEKYQESTFWINAAKYSSFGIAGADLDQDYPAFEIDSPDFVLWGKNSNIVNTFGSCKDIYGVSVVANTFWIDMPQWDPMEGSLAVKIHGAHFKSDGSLNLVNFQARITKQLAKCLWGVDLTTAAQAKFSLTYEDGSAVVATMSSQMENEQFVLSATGMHLSAPTFSMKVTKAIPADSVKQPTKKTSKTITCIKGKTKKVISGTSPKCPTGYKLSK